MRNRLSIILATLMLALVACGGAAGPQIDGGALLAAAPAAARSAGSAAVEMTIQMSGGGLPEGATIFAQGAIDWTRGESRMTMDMSSIASELGTSSIIITQEALYIRNAAMSQLGDVDWVVVRYDDVDVPGMEGLDLSALMSESQGSDPTAFLDQLAGTSDDVTDLGVEDVRGTSTTHYRAQIDTQLAVTLAREQGRDSTAQTLQSLIDSGAVPESYDVDVWVDDDGLPRRMVMALTQDQGGQEITLNLTMDLFDYGTDVAIEIPDDATPLVDLLGQ